MPGVQHQTTIPTVFLSHCFSFLIVLIAFIRSILEKYFFITMKRNLRCCQRFKTLGTKRIFELFLKLMHYGDWCQ